MFYDVVIAYGKDIFECMSTWIGFKDNVGSTKNGQHD